MSGLEIAALAAGVGGGYLLAAVVALIAWRSGADASQERADLRIENASLGAALRDERAVTAELEDRRNRLLAEREDLRHDIDTLHRQLRDLAEANPGLARTTLRRLLEQAGAADAGTD